MLNFVVQSKWESLFEYSFTAISNFEKCVFIFILKKILVIFSTISFRFKKICLQLDNLFFLLKNIFLLKKCLSFEKEITPAKENIFSTWKTFFKDFPHWNIFFSRFFEKYFTRIVPSQNFVPMVSSSFPIQINLYAGPTEAVYLSINPNQNDHHVPNFLQTSPYLRLGHWLPQNNVQDMAAVLDLSQDT